MKWFLGILTLVGIAMVVFVPPGVPQLAQRQALYENAPPMLPMTFRHNNHFDVACATCHHEFVDGTTGLPCIACHATEAKVAPMLEDQFHTLCRTCHVRERSSGKPSGPTRSCLDCHLPDSEF